MQERSAREMWRAVLGRLQLQMPQTTFDQFLRDSRAVGFDDSRLVVEVPTTFAVAWLERRMYRDIQLALEQLAQRPVDLRFRVSADSPPLPPDPARGEPQSARGEPVGPPPALAENAQDQRDNDFAVPAGASQPSAGFAFNPRYTFDSYVVGPSNQMAYNAAQAVADAPGQGYNPLFLYSGVGLGKTHLLYAIGRSCSNRGLSVLYVTSEQFTNEFISAIRTQTTEEFRNRYRSVQVLLMDDVQFMSGKEQTKESFFHTFNDLHNSGRQVVLTSDRPPNALALLEDRLRSRFEWGLIADIQPPNLETRMAILSAKAEELHVSLDDGILELIAKRVQRNVRELEGVLNRLVAYSHLMDQPINPQMASTVLDQLTAGAARHAIEPQRIIEQVSQHFKVTTDELLGKRRTKKIAQARQVAMYLLMHELEMSPTQVGRLLGGRDHATVIHGAGKINGEINEDHQLRQSVLTVKEAIFT